MPPTDPVLAVDDLTKVYRGRPPKVAVGGISFALGRGEILGLLGPNGAGKTTTIQMLLSTLKPTSGRVSYFGRSLETDREAVLARVGYASAYSKLPMRLTVAENLDVYGGLYGMPRGDRAARSRELLSWFGVWDLRGRVMSGLSAGETTRVMLAKAFLARPSVVLLDEPTASLDPDIALEVRRFVRDRRDKEGVSMVYTSHNMDEVEEVCDRVIFLADGRIVDEGRPEDLAATAATTRVRLRVVRGLDDLRGAAGARGLEVRSLAEDDGLVEVETDERHVAGLLADLAAAGVDYSEVSLLKPTLEDYFLRLASRRNGTKPAATETETANANATEATRP